MVQTSKRAMLDDVMTYDPLRLPSGVSVRAAALLMQRECCGAVVIGDDDQLLGLLTDRDIVVRCLAEGLDPDETPVEAVCSGSLATLSPTDEVRHAVSLMSQRAIRRIPIVEAGQLVGIVSLGDLAAQEDLRLALTDISGAAPSR